MELIEKLLPVARPVINDIEAALLQRAVRKEMQGCRSDLSLRFPFAAGNARILGCFPPLSIELGPVQAAALLPSAPVEALFNGTAVFGGPSRAPRR